MASADPRRGEIWLVSLRASRLRPETLREVEHALAMVLGLDRLAA